MFYICPPSLCRGARAERGVVICPASKPARRVPDHGVIRVSSDGKSGFGF